MTRGERSRIEIQPGSVEAAGASIARLSGTVVSAAGGAGAACAEAAAAAGDPGLCAALEAFGSTWRSALASLAAVDEGFGARTGTAAARYRSTDDSVMGGG